MTSLLSPPHLLDGARWAGRRVGLLGGSFNPPHEGHLHASDVAMQMLKLDAIWWLVTPQNPLKGNSELKSFEERIALCRDMVAHRPHIIVSGIEQDIGTNLSYETLSALRNHFPRTDFVWITGMDIALTIHEWNHWRDLLALVATAHVARPPALTLIESCPLRMMHQQNHIFLDKAGKKPLTPGNSYWLLQKRMLEISSTEIRNSN